MFLLTSIAWPYRGLRYRPTEFEVFFEGIRWQVETFQMIAGSSSIFLTCIWNKSCSWTALSNWPRTRKFNRLLHLHAGKAIAFDFSHCHALITLYVQFLCSDWSKFDRWVHAENLCSVETCFLLELTEFCVILWCFNFLFLLGVQNEIQLLSRLFCNSWLVCLLCFLLTNAPLVKVIGNAISDGIVFKKELTHLPLLKA